MQRRITFKYNCTNLQFRRSDSINKQTKSLCMCDCVVGVVLSVRKTEMSENQRARTSAETNKTQKCSITTTVISHKVYHASSCGLTMIRCTLRWVCDLSLFCLVHILGEIINTGGFSVFVVVSQIHSKPYASIGESIRRQMYCVRICVPIFQLEQYYHSVAMITCAIQASSLFVSRL